MYSGCRGRRRGSYQMGHSVCRSEVMTTSKQGAFFLRNMPLILKSLTQLCCISAEVCSFSPTDSHAITELPALQLSLSCTFPPTYAGTSYFIKHSARTSQNWYDQNLWLFLELLQWIILSVKYAHPCLLFPNARAARINTNTANIYFPYRG